MLVFPLLFLFFGVPVLLDGVGLSLSLLIGALLVLQLRSPGEAVPIRKSLDSFPTALGSW